jgi:hypothetical protein
MTKPGGPASVMRSLPIDGRPRRRKIRTVVTVTIYDPRKLAVLRTATALGAPLSVSFDGFKLTIRAGGRHV